jgi:hypothetical protein
MNVKNLVYRGLNGRVAAINRDISEIVWQWRAATPRMGGQR